ncbi:MAG: TIR domain-containing protein [Clostridia bacterium]|nr:TIR domain-containing protein [Clostridia bacterium]
MTILQCKYCGAPLKNVKKGSSTAQCEYCRNIVAVPALDDDLKLQMLNKATELRVRREYDRAAQVYQSVVVQFPEEAEAYFGLCLCKYGVEYVEDPGRDRKIPTCNRTLHTSILLDADYLSALKYAGNSVWKYKKDAEEIDELQKTILEIAREQKPYDIFISYKREDAQTGERTQDSIRGQQLYTELKSKGYNVFFAEWTLNQTATGSVKGYEPYVYSALHTAKIMILLGSKKEYFEGVWVRNEWSRFLDLANTDEQKTLIPCYSSIDDLPKELSHIQALDMTDIMFVSRLMGIVEKKLPLSKKEDRAKQTAGAGTEQTYSRPDFSKAAEVAKTIVSDVANTAKNMFSDIASSFHKEEKTNKKEDEDRESGSVEETTFEQTRRTEKKSKLLAIIFHIALGAWGVGDFYLGFTNKGLQKIFLSILSSGLIGTIWSLFDAYKLWKGEPERDAEGVIIE